MQWPDITSVQIYTIFPVNFSHNGLNGNLCITQFGYPSCVYNHTLIHTREQYAWSQGNNIFRYCNIEWWYVTQLNTLEPVSKALYDFYQTKIRIACCLTAPSYYLNQCWLIIKGFLWHSLKSGFTQVIIRLICYICLTFVWRLQFYSFYNKLDRLSGYGVSHVKDGRNRLIYNTGIPVLLIPHPYIEIAPWFSNIGISHAIIRAYQYRNWVQSSIELYQVIEQKLQRICYLYWNPNINTNFLEIISYPLYQLWLVYFDVASNELNLWKYIGTNNRVYSI